MTDHEHTFKLPRPNGPTSIGKCRCGESREMYNTLNQDKSSREAHWLTIRDHQMKAKKARKKGWHAEMH